MIFERDWIFYVTKFHDYRVASLHINKQILGEHIKTYTFKRLDFSFDLYMASVSLGGWFKGKKGSGVQRTWDMIKDKKKVRGGGKKIRRI